MYKFIERDLKPDKPGDREVAVRWTAKGQENGIKCKIYFWGVCAGG